MRCGECKKKEASKKCCNAQCGACCSGCRKHKHKNGNNKPSSSRAAAGAGGGGGDGTQRNSTSSSSGKRKAKSAASTPYMDDSGMLAPPKHKKLHLRYRGPPSPRSPLERICDELEDDFEEVSHKLGIDTPKERRYKIIRRIIIDHILKKRRKKQDSNYPTLDLIDYQTDSSSNRASSYSQSYACDAPDHDHPEDCKMLAEDIVHYGYNDETGGHYGPPMLRDLRALVITRSSYGSGYGSRDVWDDMQRDDPYPKQDEDDLEKYYDSDGSYVCEWQYVEKHECQEVLNVLLHARSSYSVDPPLVRFARSGNEGMVLALLGEGAHIDGCLTWEETEWKMGGYEKSWNWNGDSALMACAREGDDDMVSLLLRLGASRNHRCCYACDHHDNSVADAARRYGKAKTAELIEKFAKKNENKIDFPGLSLFGLAAAALPCYTGVPDSLLDKVVMARAETKAKQHLRSRW